MLEELSSFQKECIFLDLHFKTSKNKCKKKKQKINFAYQKKNISQLVTAKNVCFFHHQTIEKINKWPKIDKNPKT